MAAIIRVKRRISIDPQDALLISAKRLKTDDNNSTDFAPLSNLINYTGTVKNQDDNVINHVTQYISKEEARKNFKKHNVDILSKMREDMKNRSKESRYKIINYNRSLNNNENPNETNITVIDVEDSESSGKSNKDKDNYVYDLYYTETGSNMVLDQISIFPIEYELVENENTSDNENVYDDDEEDSNSESNPQNDYPDEDSDDSNSINEDDMLLAMEDMNIGNNLSSDEEFAYGLEDNDKYARYASKLQRMENRGSNYSDAGSYDSDDSEDDYFRSYDNDD